VYVRTHTTRTRSLWENVPLRFLFCRARRRRDGVNTTRGRKSKTDPRPPTAKGARRIYQVGQHAVVHCRPHVQTNATVARTIRARVCLLWESWWWWWWCCCCRCRYRNGVHGRVTNCSENCRCPDDAFDEFVRTTATPACCGEFVYAPRPNAAGRAITGTETRIAFPIDIPRRDRTASWPVNDPRRSRCVSV